MTTSPSDSVIGRIGGIGRVGRIGKLGKLEFPLAETVLFGWRVSFCTSYWSLITFNTRSCAAFMRRKSRGVASR